MKRLATFCAALALILSLVTLSAGLGQAPGKKQANPRNYEVRMLPGNKFDGKDIEIQLNDTVTWINASPQQHSATPDDDSELKFTEIVLTAGKFSDRIKFDKVGKVKYHCKFHGGMTGTITVK